MPEPEADPLVILPVPPLRAVLTQLEEAKGSPLSQDEVHRARDIAICLTVRRSVKLRMEDARGYQDLDPENVWEEWQGLRAQAARTPAE